ncbi:MAG TPA: VWA domain-containing protein [Acidobacteriaceae bacterium]|jgi:VWFA-related protein|nr:VWA domain-containing protein [Acidobacteriaceae bacterium]
MRAVCVAALSLVLPGTLCCHSGPSAALAQAQQQVPNAPAPQAQPSSLPDLRDQVAPGKGTGAPLDQDAAGAAAAGQPAPKTSQGTVPATPAAQQTPPPGSQATPPQMGPASKSPYTLRTYLTVVDVPVTVRDKHGALVSGLPWWRFRVFEDGVRQNIAFFSTDAYPLSIALVVDATLPADIMQKVNQSFSVISNTLTPADTVAVISYAGTSPQLDTNFTAAGGPRLSAALEIAKRPGERMGVPLTGGPFGSGPTVNGQLADPTLAIQRGNSSGILFPEKESHPLNDAILYAAEQLASQPRGRRRVIYVISDGKNSRSKASYKEVVQYLLAHNISVSGTDVGDAAMWGFGYLDRTKLPFFQPEDVLPRYVLATGGDIYHEMSENGIQTAFSRISDSVRTAYDLQYVSHQPTISGKYHVIDVRVEGLSGLTVDAKQGYYPSATEY